MQGTAESFYNLVRGNLPASLLVEYPENTACIRYRDGSGKDKDWFVSGLPGIDNEDTLREHLCRHMPAAKFIGWAIK
jgi:hypothetical protein